MSRQPANEIEAHELALYAVNTAALYHGRAKPIIANLARKIIRGQYDAERALKAWAGLSEAAAKSYRAEFGPMDCGFAPATRELAAHEIAQHYAEQLRDAADDLATEAENRREWPYSAVRQANESAGQYFFSRDTMRFFGDTMASFNIVYDGPSIYVVRVRAPAKAPSALAGRRMIGERRLFNPETGHIGCVIGQDGAA